MASASRPEDRPAPVAFSAPWFDEAETRRITEALAGRGGGDGPFGRRVEERLAENLGAHRVLLTTSCTHALELALLALGVGRDDEVVCPSFTFVSTANAILRVGGRPVFADIAEDTLGLDPADVERCLGPRDAAQGLGAAFRGRPLGTLGDAGCLSFHETKNVTCGEGGALVLRNRQLAARAEVIREKGTNRSAFLRGEVDKYTWVAEGSSYVLSDLLAAVLDAQLDKMPEIQRRRGAVVRRYREGLAAWAQQRVVRLRPELP